MQTLLYIIWFTVPALFFIIALWAKLESWSGQGNKGKPSDQIKQGLFVLACTLITVAIDQYILEDIVNNYLDPFIPLVLAQMVLFPLVLFIAAQIVGGTKPLQIQSNRANQQNSRQRRRRR